MIELVLSNCENQRSSLSIVTGCKLQKGTNEKGEERLSTYVILIFPFQICESQPLLLKSMFQSACHSAEGITLQKAFPAMNLSHWNK